MATLKKQWQDELQQANQNLQALNAQQPAAFSSENTALKNAALDAINNRQKFSYDVNADALYQQYKDKYLNLGKLAMQDTVGKTSALTGGYGNSYAQNAGQQAYQQYVTQLNDKIPELYSLAYSQYQDEGNDLKDRYKLYAQQEADDYDRYRDTVQDFNVNRNYWQGVGENAQNGLYKLSRDAVNDAQDMRNYNLKLGLDSKGNPITINNGTGSGATTEEPVTGWDSKTYNSIVDKIHEYIYAEEPGKALNEIRSKAGSSPAQQLELACEALVTAGGNDEIKAFIESLIDSVDQATLDALNAKYPELERYFPDEDNGKQKDPYPENPAGNKYYFSVGGGDPKKKKVILRD